MTLSGSGSLVSRPGTCRAVVTESLQPGPEADSFACRAEVLGPSRDTSGVGAGRSLAGCRTEVLGRMVSASHNRVEIRWQRKRLSR